MYKMVLAAVVSVAIGAFSGYEYAGAGETPCDELWAAASVVAQHNDAALVSVRKALAEFRAGACVAPESARIFKYLTLAEYYLAE